MLLESPQLELKPEQKVSIRHVFFPFTAVSEVSPPLPVWFINKTDTQQSPTSLDDESQVRLNRDISILPTFIPADNRLNVREFDFDIDIIHFKVEGEVNHLVHFWLP